MTIKSIAIYLPDLSGGGAERLQINLARYFLGQGIEVDFVLDRAEGPLLADVPPGAKVIGLGNRHVLRSLLPLAKYLRRRQPDILLSNLNHNNIVAVWAGKLSCARTKIIVAQHSVVSGETVRLGGKHRYIPFLYRLFLPWAAGVVAVSKGMATDMETVTKLPLERITVIYNGVITPDFDTRAAAPAPHSWFAEAIPVFVAAGRLVEQKDFPTLIRAMSEFNKHRAARLIIIGEGPLRPELQALVHQLGLDDKVTLAGFQRNALPFLRQAAVVALSSVYEGFAIVLAEALACGTSVVSTDCPEGPSEILDKGKYGHLVAIGDAPALACALADMLDHPMPRDFLRARGVQFSVEACGAQYLELFETVAGA